MPTKTAKRILSITIERIDDPDGDTSWLGEYSNTADTEFAIDRTHTLDCRINLEHIEESEDDFGRSCTCEGVALERGSYRYFNPGTVEPFDATASWIPAEIEDKRAYWLEEMRKNAKADYERVEAYSNCEWSFVGVQARAEIVIGTLTQTISSGGLWGIESDSEESYFAEVGKEELGELRKVLHELGFSKRAIAAAVKETNL